MKRPPTLICLGMKIFLKSSNRLFASNRKFQSSKKETYKSGILHCHQESATSATVSLHLQLKSLLFVCPCLDGRCATEAVPITYGKNYRRSSLPIPVDSVLTGRPYFIACAHFDRILLLAAPLGSVMTLVSSKFWSYPRSCCT